MSVAVIGAGLTGTCIALELAAQGWAVDLFDRCELPIQRASLQNEGKLHLGYVYGLDPSLRTARRMLEGAAAFRRLIGRWIDTQRLEACRSQPFLYAVPSTSLLPAAAVRRHLEAVDRLIDAVDPEGLAPYRGWRELNKDELAEQFDPRRIVAAFHTGEIALDPAAVAVALREVLGASTVRLRMGSEVRCLQPDGNSWTLKGLQGTESFTQLYNVVVNASWEQRLALDAPLGLSSGRQVMHRYKLGIRTRPGLGCAGLPSVTFCLGSFGDSVAYPAGGYLSWYPTGLLRQETSPIPSAFTPELSQQQQNTLVRTTLEGIGTFLPQAVAQLDPDPEAWQVVGGWISAWGRTGIDDPSSELHRRHDIGVHSRGSHHSIDTGKWSMAPLLAAETCARIGPPP